MDKLKIHLDEDKTPVVSYSILWFPDNEHIFVPYYKVRWYIDNMNAIPIGQVKLSLQQLLDLISEHVKCIYEDYEKDK